MALNKLQGKIKIKTSSIAGDEPALAPSSDHTDGTWSRVDCYAGELFLNMPDEKLFVMLDDGPRRISLSDGNDDDCCVWIRDGEDIRTVENADTSPVIYPNILPSADDMQDIGSATYRWKDLYLGSQINFLTDLQFVLGGVSPDQTVIRIDSSGLEVQDGYFISGENNQAKIEFGTTGSERLYLTSDGGTGAESWLDLNATTSSLGYFTSGEIGSSRIAFTGGTINIDGIVGNYQYVYSFQGLSGSSSQVQDNSAQTSTKIVQTKSYISIGLIDNNTSFGDGEMQVVFNRDAAVLAADVYGTVKKWPVIIGAEVEKIYQGVENSVAVGGDGHHMTTSDVLYTSTIGFNIGGGSPVGSAQTLLQFTTPTAAHELWFPAKSGILTTLSGGTLVEFNTSVGNVGTGEDDLYSYTVPASQLGANKDKLFAEYGGTFVSSGTATRQIKVYFGGTAIFDTGALSITGSSDWNIKVFIIRVSSSVIRFTVTMNTTGAALSAYCNTGELTGLTLSNTNILKITGEAAGVGAATDDIVAMLGTIEFKAAA